MKKVLMLLVLGCFLAGCSSTNPPEAPKAKGDWQVMNTTVSNIMEGY